MKTDEKITLLIAALRRIQMCKSYRKDLQRRIGIAERKLQSFTRKKEDLQQALKRLEWNPLRKLVRINKRKKKEEERLYDDYYQLTMAKKDCEKDLDLLAFELALMEEKIIKEAKLKTELKIAVLERAAEAKTSKTKNLKAVIKHYKRKDKLQDLGIELLEIIEAGETVKTLIDDILYNVKHHLEKKYHTGYDNSFIISYKPKNKEGIKEINKLSRALKKALGAMKEEVADVYEDEEVVFAHKHYKKEYLTTIYNGELTAKQLFKQDIVEANIELLKEVLHDIEGINSLFEKELVLIEKEIEGLQTQIEEALGDKKGV